jgi:hypothetical protein
MLSSLPARNPGQVPAARFAHAQVVRRGANPTITPVSVLTLGLNHTTAPLDLRGKLAFAPERIAPALQAVRVSLGRTARSRTRLYLQPHRALSGR